MLKYLLAIGLIFGVAIYISCQYQNAAAQPEQPAAKNASTRGTAISNDRHSPKDAKNSEWYLPRWYRLFAWPDGITTWAVLLTLLAIAEQTHQTAKAAQATKASSEAMLKSVELQSLAYKQWVDVTKWKTAFVRDEKNGKYLRIQFDIVNPTNFPLTISQIRYTIMKDIECVTGQTFCPPKSPFALTNFCRLQKCRP
jgi:hypothetical protein